MGHRSVVARYTADGSPLVLVEASAERLSPGPWDTEPTVGTPPAGTARAVRVAQMPARKPPSWLAQELEREGDDVLVLLLAGNPADLPVGPFLQEVLRHGHRVVEATPVTSRFARSAIVLTRDPEVPMAAYLLGTPLSGEDAVRRALAEHLVEGLVTRAQRVTERARVAELEEQLGALREAERAAQQRAAQLQERAAQLQQKATGLQERLTAVQKRLVVVQAAQSTPAHRAVRRAERVVAVVREDPVRAPGRIGRALRRRLRRD